MNEIVQELLRIAKQVESKDKIKFYDGNNKRVASQLVRLAKELISSNLIPEDDEGVILVYDVRDPDVRIPPLMCYFIVEDYETANDLSRHTGQIADAVEKVLNIRISDANDIDIDVYKGSQIDGRNRNQMRRVPGEDWRS
jgi:hypothetical protein